MGKKLKHSVDGDLQFFVGANTVDASRSQNYDTCNWGATSWRMRQGEHDGGIRHRRS